MSFAHSQASYAASQLNITSENKPYDKSIDNYIKILNNAFMGLCTFSIENDIVTVTNNIEEVIVNGTRKKQTKKLYSFCLCYFVAFICVVQF